MSTPSAFERFLNKEDQLSGLLAALPAYTPSPEHEKAVISAILAHQPEAPVFEPTEHLSQAFAQEAAKIEAAQATRRAALRAAMDQGQAAQDILGAALSPATETWLQHTLSKAEKTPPAPKRRTSSLWRDLGLVATAAALATVVTQVYLRTNTAPIEAPPQALTAPQTSSPTRIAAETARSNSEPVHTLAVPASPAPQEQGRQALLKPQAKKSASQPKAKGTPIIAAAKEAQADSAPAAPAISEPLVVAAPPSDNTSARTGMQPMLAHPAPAAAPPPRLAEHAPMAKMAKPQALPSSQSCLVVSLKYDPALVAQHLDMTQCGPIVALKTALPDVPETQSWVERFKQALPEAHRPANLPLEKDVKVPLNLISIETQVDSTD